MWFLRRKKSDDQARDHDRGDDSSVGREFIVPDQYSTIQRAIDAAEPGDVVVVQPGRYRERIDFEGKDITVRGTDPNNKQVVRQTIIDGGRGGCVVTFRSGETEQAVLAGLCITNGLGTVGTWPYGGGISVVNHSCPTIERNVIDSNASQLDGAGIYIDDSSPMIRYNVITANHASGAGGGVHAGRDFVPPDEATPEPPARDTYARFLDAASPAPMRIGVTQGDAPGAGELAMGQWLAEPKKTERRVAAQLVGNTFMQNQALSGGGLHVSDSSPHIEGNSFRQNEAARGAGITCWDNSRPVIARNHIVENSATCEGGGIMIEWGASPAVIANTLRDNDGPRGAALSVAPNASPIIKENCFTGDILRSGQRTEQVHLWQPERVVLENNHFD